MLLSTYDKDVYLDKSGWGFFINQSIFFSKVYGSRVYAPHLQTGWGNGYVIVPPSTWFAQMPYIEVDEIMAAHLEFYVHGGLTYDGKIEKGDWLHKVVGSGVGSIVYGFDTAHHMDNLLVWPKERVLEHTKELFINLIKLSLNGS